MAKKESSPGNSHPEAKGFLFILIAPGFRWFAFFSTISMNRSTNWMGPDRPMDTAWS